jgi:sodium/hydrogen antiporter
MDHLNYAIIATFIIAYGLISKRIRTTAFTGPICFVVFGFLLCPDVTGLITQKNHLVINIIATLTLVFILFSDASRINFSVFRKEHDLPRRLLSIGLPLTIIFGLGSALMIFTGLTIWEAAVLATILAPTDAALAQAVINSERVPQRIREALNVESGLNDGICFPILLLFLSLATMEETGESASYWMTFISLQLILGPIVGSLIGYIGGKLVTKAVESNWMSGKFQRLSVIGLSLMAYLFAGIVGGNGFIAAFFAGLVFGTVARKVSGPIYEFAEAEGELFILLTFMLFGAILVPDVIGQFDPYVLLYAVLSLTVIRIIPVAFSVIGKGLSIPTKLYLGWFGPRGAASILYLLLVVDQYDLVGESIIYQVSTTTILLSVFAHGLTATWGAKVYAATIDATHEQDKQAEMQDCSCLPTRVSH